MTTPHRISAFVAFAAGCGAPSSHPSAPRSSSSLDRFVEVLRNGQSVYGPGTGCDEWRATPGDPDLDLSSVSDDGDEAANADQPPPDDDNETEASPAPWSFAGELTARPDHEGRVYRFAYYVYLEQTPVRMRISGRGGWSPTPGVVIRSPDDPENVVIGVGSYCTTEVDVRTDPQRQDAVLVGDETWYLTQAACLRSAHRTDRRPGCSSKGR